MKKRKHKIKRTAIKCRTFSSFSDPEYSFDDPSDLKAIQETLRIAPRKPGGSGRKTSLTPLREHIILKAIKLGMPVERAANLAGVDLSTVYQWKRFANEGEFKEKGTRDSTKYKIFIEKLKVASIHGELEKLKLVNEAAEGGVPIEEIKTKVHVNPRTGKETVLSKETRMKTSHPSWQAAMTLLERRYPERWGKVVQVDEEDALVLANKIKNEVDRIFESVPPKKGSK